MSEGFGGGGGGGAAAQEHPPPPILAKIKIFKCKTGAKRVSGEILNNRAPIPLLKMSVSSHADHKYTAYWQLINVTT